MTHLPRLVHVSMLSRSHALTSAALRTLFRARPPALCPAAAHAAHSCCWALTRPRTRTRAASAESSCAERAGEACGAKPPVGRRDPDAACGATREGGGGGPRRRGGGEPAALPVALERGPLSRRRERARAPGRRSLRPRVLRPPRRDHQEHAGSEAGFAPAPCLESPLDVEALRPVLGGFGGRVSAADDPIVPGP